jgi:hypothetical protein
MSSLHCLKNKVHTVKRITAHLLLKKMNGLDSIITNNVIRGKAKAAKSWAVCLTIDAVCFQENKILFLHLHHLSTSFKRNNMWKIRLLKRLRVRNHDYELRNTPVQCFLNWNPIIKNKLISIKKKTKQKKKKLTQKANIKRS